MVVIWGTVAWLVWASGDSTASMNEQQWLSQALPFYAILVVVAYAAHRFVSKVFDSENRAPMQGNNDPDQKGS